MYLEKEWSTDLLENKSVRDPEDWNTQGKDVFQLGIKT